MGTAQKHPWLFGKDEVGGSNPPSSSKPLKLLEFQGLQSVKLMIKSRLSAGALSFVSAAAAMGAVTAAGAGAKALALLFVFNEGVDNGKDNGDQNKTNQNISQHGKRSFLKFIKIRWALPRSAWRHPCRAAAAGTAFPPKQGPPQRCRGYCLRPRTIRRTG